jgi:hypothetical protein
MLNLLFAGVILIGPFVGQVSETFEAHPQTLQKTCVPDRVFGGRADLCVRGDTTGFGNCTIASKFTSAACTTNPQAGTKFLWTQTSGFPSSYVDIIFDEPVIRFGGYFAYWNSSTGMTATFYSEDGNQIGAFPMAGLPDCIWTWNGFAFDTNLPCKRVKIQNAYWFGVEMDSLQADIATLQPGIDTCLPAGNSVIACPCSNMGIFGRGCANSVNNQGAKLTSVGNPSLSADTLVFTGAGMLPTTDCILVQVTPGTSYAYGQGVMCGIVHGRIFTKMSSAGSIVIPALGDQSISARAILRGDPLQPGMGRLYAIIYLDTAILGGCNNLPRNYYNTTQSQKITWSL